MRRIWSTRMHCHNSYEIYYMITGNVEYLLEGRPYRPRPGSLLVIAPGCFHGLRVLDGNEYHRIRLHFAGEILSDRERELLLQPFGKSWGCLEEQFALESVFSCHRGLRELWKRFTGYCNPRTNPVSFGLYFCNIFKRPQKNVWGRKPGSGSDPIY